MPPQNGYRHLPEVVAWNQSVFEAVSRELSLGRLPVLLGGDHSLAIGSITAVAAHCRREGKRLRVLWLDAHADFNSSAITPSGNVLACRSPACAAMARNRSPGSVAARRPSRPRRFASSASVRSIRRKSAWCTDVGLEVFDMRYIDEMGMRDAVQMSLALIDSRTHLHVSFDVTSRSRHRTGRGHHRTGRPTYREAQLCMEMIADTGRLGSVDVVELNPALDLRNRTAEVAVELIESMFGKSTLMRR